MKKIKGVLLTVAITVIAVIFFSGFAMAARVTNDSKFIGHVFIDGGKDNGFIKVNEEYFFPHLGGQLLGDTVQKIQALEGIVEVNRKLVRNGRKGKTEKDSGKEYRKRRDGDDDDDDDEIIITEEEEKNEGEQEQERKQEEKRKQEEEKRQEKERKREEKKINKEDLFR